MPAGSGPGPDRRPRWTPPSSPRCDGGTSAPPTCRAGCPTSRASAARRGPSTSRRRPAAVLSTFGFDSYDIYLSTRPEKYVGTPESWERATDALRLALEKRGLPYEVDEGGGAFYGPKIDIKIKDSLNRAWQCSTIQVDFNNPDRFDVTYRGSDGKEHRPIMIHRALMGSLERFFGVLVEHHAGAFPVWLSPVQVALLTIAERHGEHVIKVAGALRSEGIRTVTNLDNEKIGHKIRKATIKKIPYLVIIGDKEMTENMVTVRKRSGENIGPFTPDEFIALMKEKVGKKSQEL